LDKQKSAILIPSNKERQNMKEKNKAGRVSKKTIATVLIAMIGTVGIGMCMSIAWSYAAPEIAKELWIYFVSFNLSNL
jgi:hypothetical protein